MNLQKEVKGCYWVINLRNLQHPCVYDRKLLGQEAVRTVTFVICLCIKWPSSILNMQKYTNLICLHFKVTNFIIEMQKKWIFHSEKTELIKIWSFCLSHPLGVFYWCCKTTQLCWVIKHKLAITYNVSAWNSKWLLGIEVLFSLPVHYHLVLPINDVAWCSFII